MAEVIRPMRQKTGTAAQWASANPVLGAGEIGLDTTNRIRKTGDGVRTWAQLSAEYIGDPAWSAADTFNRANTTSIAGADWFAASYNNLASAPRILNATAIRDNYNPNQMSWADAAIHRSNSRSLAHKAQIEIVALTNETTQASFTNTPPTAITLRAPIVKLPDLTQVYTINSAAYTDSVAPSALFLGIKTTSWYVYVHALARASYLRTTDVADAGYCIARGTGSFTGAGVLAAQITADNIATLTYKGTVLWSDEIPSAPTGTYCGFGPGGSATTLRNFAASNL